MKKKREHVIEQVAHESETLNPAKAPKKHTLGPGDDQLHVGSLVFYHGDRHYVSICPESWEQTHHIRITNKRLMRDPATEVLREDKAAECFHCHADCVDLIAAAQKKGNRYGKQPTMNSIARAERAKSGQKDVGDEVAELLRPLTLDQMFEAAATYLGEGLGELKDKYQHLDNGRKRMTLGNRMRAKFRKEGA